MCPVIVRLAATTAGALLVGTACAGSGPAPGAPAETVSTSGTEPAGTATRVPEPARPTSPPGWERLDWAPTMRTEVTAATAGTRLHVIGGFDGAGASVRTVEVYDAETGRWEEGPDLPVGLNHAMAAAVDGSVYVFGGYRGFLADASEAAFRLEGDTWREVAPMPQARAAGGVADLDGRVYVAGGMHDPDGHGHALAEGEMLVYDTAEDAWHTEPGPPTPREHVGAASLGGHLYLVGGRTGSEGNVAAMERYDPATAEWEVLDDLPTERSGLAVTAACGRYVVAVGGEQIGTAGGKVHEEVEAYDVVDRTWRTLPPMLTPRHGLGVGVVGSELYTLSGGPSAGLVTSNAAEALDLSDLPGCG